MLAELRTKSQITIPKEIITQLGLEEGDKLEVYEKDGVIQLVPVAVYPKKYVEELYKEVDKVKADVASGKRPVFDNIDALFESLENS